MYRDQIGRKLIVSNTPRRLVSTVPSITELLVDLGLEDAIKGLSAWCVHPPGLRERKTVIGGTKNLDIPAIKSLKPDLIIANKEENPKEQIETLAKHFPVWVSDVRSIDQGLEMIEGLADILEVSEAGAELCRQIKEERQSLKQAQAPRVLYFIWKEPWMVAGHDTYVSAMLEEKGMINLAPNHKGRYPEINWSEIQALNPDIILLSSEPYQFKAKDLKDFHQAGFKSVLLNGEYFTWYGSRMIKALQYLRKSTWI